MRLPLITFLAAVAAAASFAPTASAASQRYASPTGSGTACTSASPCGIATAVGGAKLDDEVVVAPGDYPLTATLATPTRMTIHGVAGKPRPRLIFSGASQGGLRVTSNSTLRYVEVDQAPGTDASALFASESQVDQVIARASGAGDTAEIQKSTIRNSVVVASGATGRAMRTSTTGVLNSSIYRNVTAIASGSNGIAILADAGFAAGNASVTLVNVIARGVTGVEARTDGSGAHATIFLVYSNYIAPVTVGSNAKVVNFGGNQTGAPIFADWQAGDYREGPGSVTIDAGLDDDVFDGPLDVEGDPRHLGTVDIGADELVPPPSATTGAATAVGAGSATVSGSVDAHGGPTTYRFQYGPTTAYGSSTASTNAGTGTAVATASVSGLKPATTYHYRLVATNSGGVADGADRTFTTAAAPPPPPPPPPSSGSTNAPTPTSSTPSGTTPSPSPFAGVALVSRKLAYAHKTITIGLRCPAGTVGRCSGRTQLTTRARTHRIRLGRARFSIAAGGRARVKVHVAQAGRRVLRSASRLRARAVNAAHDGAGRSKRTAAAVTIRRHHR